LEAKSTRSSTRVYLPRTEFAEKEGLELWRVWGFKRRRAGENCGERFVQCG